MVEIFNREPQFGNWNGIESNYFEKFREDEGILEQPIGKAISIIIFLLSAYLQSFVVPDDEFARMHLL